MIISIASGKGGTGKTTVAANLALSLGCTRHAVPIQFLDCDVEEPNAHIFLKPQMVESRPVTVPVPQVDPEKCTYCRKCAEICQFSAIIVIRENVLTFPELCHGCGACSLLCPASAITEVDRQIGVLEIGRSQALEKLDQRNSDSSNPREGIRFIHGILEVSEPMSPPLIKAVKNAAHNGGTTIIDVPPGTSCPVIEAVKGSDFCLLVTEPTPFGLNDLVLAVEMLRTLKIPFAVVVNRSDVGDDRVDDYCRNEGIPVLMKIPMDRSLAVAYSEGIPLVKMEPAKKAKFVQLFEDIKKRLQE